MEKNFIKVRFDRLQNSQLKLLYSEIVTHLDLFDADTLHLGISFVRFRDQVAVLDNLSKKTRKQPQTESILKLWKQMDDLISALLLHTKALKRANFDDIQLEVKTVYITVQKSFKNVIHGGVVNKELKIKFFLIELNKKEQTYSAFQKLGLMRYADAFVTIRQEIDKLTHNRIDYKLEQPAAGITIPSKAHIISELRLFLHVIEVLSITHPETDYRELISLINLTLSTFRTQFRNLGTREPG